MTNIIISWVSSGVESQTILCRNFFTFTQNKCCVHVLLFPSSFMFRAVSLFSHLSVFCITSALRTIYSSRKIQSYDFFPVLGSSSSYPPLLFQRLLLFLSPPLSLPPPSWPPPFKTSWESPLLRTFPHTDSHVHLISLM